MLFASKDDYSQYSIIRIITLDKIMSTDVKEIANPCIEGVDGLYLFNDVITVEEELDLIAMMNEMQEEGSSIRNKIRTRVTMHFGHTFSAKTLRVDFDDTPPPIPERLRSIIDKVIETNTKDEKSLENLSEWKYDQITINRYIKGGGISAHVDTHSSFDNMIVVISLGSPVLMRFEKDNKSVDLWTKPRSLMIMKDEARYDWTHKIPIRNTDTDPEGQIIVRDNRTSITIRKVRKDFKCDCSYKTLCDYQNPTSFHLPDRL